MKNTAVVYGVIGAAPAVTLDAEEMRASGHKAERL